MLKAVCRIWSRTLDRVEGCGLISIKMRENRLGQVAPLVVGGLMMLEAAAMFVVAGVTVIIGGLVGALAFVGGAGGASDKQIAQGFAMIALTLATPFVVTAVLGLGGLMLMMRWGRRLVIASAVVAIGAQVVFHVYLAEGFHPAGLAPLVLHLLAILVACVYVPPGSGGGARAPAALVGANASGVR